MDEAGLKLDGNAAAGLLAEIFSTDMTVSWATCVNCGAEDQLGRLVVYIHSPGTVFRCLICGEVVMRIVQAQGKVWMDLGGTARLVLPASA